MESHRDLDLDPTVPIIACVWNIFIYYKVFKFPVPISITFLVIVQKQTHTHRDSDEYSVVVFCKNATMINKIVTKFYLKFDSI